jgi:hypothetical protein
MPDSDILWSVPAVVNFDFAKKNLIEMEWSDWLRTVVIFKSEFFLWIEILFQRSNLNNLT